MLFKVIRSIFQPPLQNESPREELPKVWAIQETSSKLSRAPLRELDSQANGRLLFQGVQDMGKSGLYSR